MNDEKSSEYDPWHSYQAMAACDRLDVVPPHHSQSPWLNNLSVDRPQLHSRRGLDARFSELRFCCFVLVRTKGLNQASLRLLVNRHRMAR
jgi:hypothetical protein